MQIYTKEEQYDLFEKLAEKLVDSMQFYYRHPNARVTIVEGNDIWSLNIWRVAEHPDLSSPEFDDELEFQHSQGLYENIIDRIKRLKVKATYDTIHYEEDGDKSYIVGEDLDDSELNKVDLAFKKAIRLPLRKLLNKFLYSNYIEEKNSDKRIKNMYDAYFNILVRQAEGAVDTIKEVLKDYLDILQIDNFGNVIIVKVKDELQSKEDLYRVHDGEIAYEVVEITQDDD